MATLTIVPIWLGAFWLVTLVSGLWRDRVEQEAAAAIRATAEALSGEVQPCWNGFRVQAAGVRVAWVGGLSGLKTRIRSPDGKQRIEGLCDAPTVLEWIGGGAGG